MLDLDLIPDGGISWLDASGPDGNIVLSTRVRLARNLEGRVFTVRADDVARRANIEDVVTAGQNSKTLADATILKLDGLDAMDRQLLHERHLVSKELAGVAGDRGVGRAAALVTTGRLGVMVNEEDHLRMQCLESGFALTQAYRKLDELDHELGQRLPFAFDREFGYLTSCPTNAGTGLRASVLIHLPGLVLTKEIGRVLQGLSHVGLTFRGLYGEGSEVVGNFFQISNQTTLGKSEDELLDHLGSTVRKVIEYEEEARQILERDAPLVIGDKVWRAYGLLRYARSISFEETMNLLSGVRLGVGLNLITNLSVYTLNKLLVFTQPAHLAHGEARSLSESELASMRASYVRGLLDDDAARLGN